MIKFWLPLNCVTKHFMIHFNQRIFANAFHSFVEFQILELSAHHSIPLSSFLSQSSSRYMSLIFSNYLIYSNLYEFYHLYDMLNFMKFKLYINYCSQERQKRMMERGDEIFCIMVISLSSQVSQQSISLDQVIRLQKMTKIWLPFECETKQFLIHFNQCKFPNSFQSIVEFQI